MPRIPLGDWRSLSARGLTDRIQTEYTLDRSSSSRWRRRADSLDRSDPGLAALIRGSDSYARHRFHRALKEFKLFARANPNNDHGTIMIASTLRRLGKFTESESVLFGREARRRSP